MGKPFQLNRGRPARIEFELVAMHKKNLNYSILMLISIVSEAEFEFYLASNGTDSTSCGHNISTACRTFPWLLDVFYNESYLNNINQKLPGLNLTTTTSFEIGPEILVRLHFYKLKIELVYSRNWQFRFRMLPVCPQWPVAILQKVLTIPPGLRPIEIGLQCMYHLNLMMVVYDRNGF